MRCHRPRTCWPDDLRRRMPQTYRLTAADYYSASVRHVFSASLKVRPLPIGNESLTLSVRRCTLTTGNPWGERHGAGMLRTPFFRLRPLLVGLSYARVAPFASVISQGLANLSSSISALAVVAFAGLVFLPGLNALGGEFLLSQVDDQVFSAATRFDDFRISSNHLFFVATSANGKEVFRTDGNTLDEYDILPGPGSSFPWLNLFSGLDDFFFIRARGLIGQEVFSVDDSGALIEFDLVPGPAGSSVGNWVKVDDHVLLAINSPAGGRLAPRLISPRSSGGADLRGRILRAPRSIWVRPAAEWSTARLRWRRV